MSILDFLTSQRQPSILDAVFGQPSQATGDDAALKAYAGGLPPVAAPQQASTPGVRFATDPHDAMTHTAQPSGYVNPDFAEESGGSPLYWKNVASNPDVPVPARMAVGYGLGLPTEAIGGGIDSLARVLSLPADVYTGKVDPRSDEGNARALEAAMAFGIGASVMPKPAGSLGIFGGRGASLGGHEFIEDFAPSAMGGPQFAERTNVPGVRFDAPPQPGFRANSNYPSEQRYIDNIPPPPSTHERAISKTVGMSKDEIMSSDPLWGYSSKIAEESGIPHHVAFASLANDLFAAHGLNSYITPQIAKRHMAEERLKYGMSPWGGGITNKSAADLPPISDEEIMKYIRERDPE